MPIINEVRVVEGEGVWLTYDLPGFLPGHQHFVSFAAVHQRMALYRITLDEAVSHLIAEIIGRDPDLMTTTRRREVLKADPIRFKAGVNLAGKVPGPTAEVVGDYEARAKHYLGPDRVEHLRQ